MKTAAIILAAGEASRYGSPKQLLQIEGRNLVQRACDLAIATECSPIILVLGAHQEIIKSAGFPKDVQCIENPNWKDGMGSSLSLGIREILPSNTDAALIILADQPGIKLSTINSMKKAFLQPDVSIVLSSYETTKSPPSLFSSSHFEELSSLDDDFGGKKITEKHKKSVAIIPAPEASWDIDDPNEWAKFQSLND